jgi:ABC-type multidrug transport system fused ATPase/permease subunit
VSGRRASPSPPANRSVFRRMFPYLRPHWRALAVGLVCLLISVPAGHFHPLVWAFMVDQVIMHRRVEMLLPAMGLMFLVQAVGTVIGAYRDNLLQKVGQRLVFELRNEVYEKLQRQSLGYLHDNRAGDLVSRTMSDVDVLQDVAVQGTDSIIANLFSFLFVAAILLTLNWKLGIVTLVPIFLVFLLNRFFNARVKALYRAARDLLGQVSARLQENLQGMVVIKAYAKEPYELSRFRAVTQEYQNANFRAINARTVFFPAVQMVGFISNVLSVGFGAWLVLAGQFTIGGLVAYRGYWWPLFSPISSLASINDMLQRAQAAGSRVFELLDEVEAIQDAPDAQELQVTQGRIEFRHVTFSYSPRSLSAADDEAGATEAPQVQDNGASPDSAQSRRGKIVLQDVSFVVEPGEMVALVGPSGAGKTTVLNLVMRFWDPNEGEILIDGQNIARVTQESLRRHTALVLQETFLFNGTVLENLLYGRQDATMEEIEQAVRDANAADFIRDLPRGYETEIGERGVKLSGGQRQRLSIARAFLSNPEILILDEPVSSVEPESEAVITQALERLMQGRTTFVTSHRYSLVRGADRILVFEQGRLVEQGNHDALMQANGLYAAMYRQQMGMNERVLSGHTGEKRL